MVATAAAAVVATTAATGVVGRGGAAATEAIGGQGAISQLEEDIEIGETFFFPKNGQLTEDSLRVTCCCFSFFLAFEPPPPDKLSEN